VATEAILDIKKEGTSKPMWTREQVDEIVMGQVMKVSFIDSNVLI